MPRPETDLRHMCYRLDREELHRKDYAGTRRTPEKRTENPRIREPSRSSPKTFMLPYPSSALKTISSPRATTPLHRSAPLDSKKRALTKSPPKTPEEAMT
ncbi:unnamed protein product [Brassica napus]|uniref:(rape) hypothetical protein n=1 Tax=Brassica napus TaxID=3708 RepID=A0A816YVE1_BRANA|nr:unnamed protein product [Brassica napus]